MKDWRDHTNGMTMADRAEAFWLALPSHWKRDWFESELTTFGHVCANAEFERRRAVEAERDALKLELAGHDAFDLEREAILAIARKSLGTRDAHSAIEGVEHMAQAMAGLRSGLRALRNSRSRNFGS